MVDNINKQKLYLILISLLTILIIGWVSRPQNLTSELNDHFLKSPVNSETVVPTEIKEPIIEPVIGQTVMDMGWINKGTYQAWGANFGTGKEPGTGCRNGFDWICFKNPGNHSVEKNDPDFINASPNFWIIQEKYPWTYLGEYPINGEAEIDFQGKTFTDILLTMPYGMGIDQITGIVVVDGSEFFVPYGYALSKKSDLKPIMLANDTYGFGEKTISKWESTNHQNQSCGIVGSQDGKPDKNVGLAKYRVGDSRTVVLLFRMLNNPAANVVTRSSFPQSLSGLEIYSVDLHSYYDERGFDEQSMDAGTLKFGDYTICP